MKNKQEVIISQGNRSLWHNILAALLYTVVICCVILFFYEMQFSLARNYVENMIDYMRIAAFALSGALYFSVIQTYYFDFKNNLYKHERSFLIFKQGKWKPLPALEYISVFKKEEGVYEVNLWYVRNKHFKIYRMFHKDEAMNVGKQLALSLRIDLLDATVANDSKWIDV